METFRIQAEKFRAVIADMPDDALHWRPGPDTNSLAVLVVHTWGAARMWTALASGREITRDRDAEFRAAPTGDELRALLDAAISDVAASVGAIDPAAFGQLTVKWGGNDDERVTRARCLIHALEHTQEHLGQALLTRQLWEQQHGRTTAEDEDGYRVRDG